jgi:hypothetical protein
LTDKIFICGHYLFYDDLWVGGPQREGEKRRKRRIKADKRCVIKRFCGGLLLEIVFIFVVVCAANACVADRASSSGRGFLSLLRHHYDGSSLRRAFLSRMVMFVSSHFIAAAFFIQPVYFVGAGDCTVARRTIYLVAKGGSGGGRLGFVGSCGRFLARLFFHSCFLLSCVFSPSPLVACRAGVASLQGMNEAMWYQDHEQPQDENIREDVYYD